MKVCKFGGTSLADAAAFRAVAQRIGEDDERRYIVVSAPGQAAGSPRKVTDLLVDLTERKTVERTLRDRFEMIVNDLGLHCCLDELFARTEHLASRNVREETLSRGEYLNAILLAKYTGIPMLDAGDMIRFRHDGTLDGQRTFAAIGRELHGVPRAVIPGFYGRDLRGKVRLFARGGSDITGALIAAAMSAEVYENFTDVSGVCLCDPRYVKEAGKIDRISYDELADLAAHGASVLQSDSVRPCRERGIPIHIRSTFCRSEGTVVTNEKAEESAIAVAGKERTEIGIGKVSGIYLRQIGKAEKSLDAIAKKISQFAELKERTDHALLYTCRLPLAECLPRVYAITGANDRRKYKAETSPNALRGLREPR